MRRRLLLCLVALATVAAACSGGGDDRAASTTTVDTRQPNERAEGIAAQGRALESAADGKLTACIDLPKPPFALDQEGRTAGIEPELLRGLTGRLGVAVEFRDLEAAALFADLDAGRCELVAAAVSATSPDATSRTTSEPFFDVTQALLVREEDATRYPDLAALRGRSVGVQAGAAGAAVVRREAGVTAVELPDLAQLVVALKEGRIDGVVHDYPLLVAAAKAAPGRTVTQRFADVTDRYVFVMAKGNASLKAAVDEALRIVRRDDTYNTAVRLYLGTTPTP